MLVIVGYLLVCKGVFCIRCRGYVVFGIGDLGYTFFNVGW